MRITFSPVGFYGTKGGICVVCGKRGTLREHFYQTQSPFNQKDADQIMREEVAKYREWKAAPFTHRKCR